MSARRKTSAESVSSGLAAVTQSAAILKKGYTELDPLVAVVDAIDLLGYTDDQITAMIDSLVEVPA